MYIITVTTTSAIIKKSSIVCNIQDYIVKIQMNWTQEGLLYENNKSIHFQINVINFI